MRFSGLEKCTRDVPGLWGPFWATFLRPLLGFTFCGLLGVEQGVLGSIFLYGQKVGLGVELWMV